MHGGRAGVATRKEGIALNRELNFAPLTKQLLSSASLASLLKLEFFDRQVLYLLQTPAFQLVQYLQKLLDEKLSENPPI